MKRARFFTFLVVGAIALAAVAFWKHPERLSLIADVFAGPAPENEWTPLANPAVQSAQSSNSANTAPSNPPAKPDLFLPAEPKSLSLNSSEAPAANPPVQPLILPAMPSEPSTIVQEPDSAPPSAVPVPPMVSDAPRTGQVTPSAASPEPLIVSPAGFDAPQPDKVPPQPTAPPIVAPEVVAPAIEKVAPPAETGVPRVDKITRPETQEWDQAPDSQKFIDPPVYPAQEKKSPPIVAPEVVAPATEKAAPPIEKPAPPREEQPLPPPVVVAPSEDIKPMAQPGETTMKTANSVMAAVVGAALLTAQAKADEVKDKDYKEVIKAVDELKAVVKKLEDLEKAQSAYRTTNEGVIRQIRDDANAMKQKLDQMEMDVKTLRQAVNTPPQQPLPSGPITSKRETSTDITQKMGRLKLVNDYGIEMDFVVNGGPSYQLLPGQSRVVSVPAGTFTYQIPQLQSSVQERSIAANEEKTIRVYPRP